MKRHLSDLEAALFSTRFASILYDQHDAEIFDVEMCVAECPDFDTPEGRQRWNEKMLKRLDCRYLIGRYREDRTKLISPHEPNPKRAGRSIHMGIDLFCEGLEPVHAPWSGKIIEKGDEPGPHGFGGWALVEHENPHGEEEKWYSLFGHLGTCQRVGAILSKGEVIGTLGDHDVNGGWSRHLHYQLFSVLPTDLFGYVTPDREATAAVLCPDPNLVLQLQQLYPLPAGLRGKHGEI